MARWVLAGSVAEADRQVDPPGSWAYGARRTLYAYGITRPGGLPAPREYAPNERGLAEEEAP